MKSHSNSWLSVGLTGMGILGLLAWLAPAFAFAATPLWSFSPLTPTTIVVPIDGEDTVSYTVQNNAQTLYQLLLTPIMGVYQVTSGLDRCASPFLLPPNGSCILELRVIGSEIASGGIHGGPDVCVATNPLICYQPSAANALNVTVGPPSQAVLEVVPRTLFLAPATTGLLQVTNTGSPNIAAQNIQVDVPVGIAIDVDAKNCAAPLAPTESCNLILSAVTAQPTTSLLVYGSNTNLVAVEVTVTDDVLFANGFE